MASKVQTPKTFSPRDIGASINNSILVACRPESSVILESRLRRLSEYAQAVVQPCMVHLEMFKSNGDPLITSEELVVALLSAALTVQSVNNPAVDKMPSSNIAKLITKGK